MSAILNDDLQDLWREHKKRYGDAPKLDWAPHDVMVQALKAAIERGTPCTKAELTGDNVVSIHKKKWINCRVFM